MGRYRRFLELSGSYLMGWAYVGLQLFCYLVVIGLSLILLAWALQRLGKIGMKVGAMKILKEKKIFFNYLKNTSYTF